MSPGGGAVPGAPAAAACGAARRREGGGRFGQAGAAASGLPGGLAPRDGRP